ncbi:putative monooxygenase p33MONOX isoform 4-T7 [Molossus nigricans]
MWVGLSFGKPDMEHRGRQGASIWKNWEVDLFLPQQPLVCMLEKLKLQSGEITREEKQPASAQSTPSSTPHSSPKQKPRGWFSSGSSTALPGPNLSTMDSGSGDKDRNAADKWSLFGPRSLQKSDSGGFATQPYRGAQKPSPMELIRMQATRMAEDPATFKPPNMDIPVMEGKKQLPRTHNLKPRDLNVLTPTGF